MASETTGIVTDNVAANDYVTFTFTSPVALVANTIYAFDLGRPASGYATFRNSDDNSYTGGTSYSSGSNAAGGGAISTHGTDRVFHLDIVAIPEPTTNALLGLGGLALILRRRK
ncbi:MAG: hypothetical protein ACI9FG_000243 [Crocinitomicaceae bacterium]|jgi:hypothetical protein